MSSSERTLKRGDRFIDLSGQWSQFIEITRVARDGSWADIRWCNWACMTTGRIKLPLPESALRRDWTLDEVEASGPGLEEAP